MSQALAAGLKGMRAPETGHEPNLAAGRWLREVAKARRHATTGEVPADRLELERPQLGPIPPPYGGQPRVTMAAAASSSLLRPLVGLQHPLALYDTLFPTALSMEAAP